MSDRFYNYYIPPPPKVFDNTPDVLSVGIAVVVVDVEDNNARIIPTTASLSLGRNSLNPHFLYIVPAPAARKNP